MSVCLGVCVCVSVVVVGWIWNNAESGRIATGVLLPAAAAAAAAAAKKTPPPPPIHPGTFFCQQETQRVS